MDLDKCPTIIKEKVENYLNEYEGSKILGVSITEGLTPYIDKSITKTVYMVAVQWINLCTSFTYSECSEEKFNTDEVYESSMSSGEILNIVNNCEYLKNSIKNNQY